MTNSKIADYWHPEDDRIVCDLCPHSCHLKEGQRGICRNRICRNNTLYTDAYGKLCAIANDPIEKKPLYHFHPGSRCLSIASAGCNLRCKNCQNWEISQVKPEDIEYVEISPASLVKRCQQLHLPTIAYTYTEPLTYFEYIHETAYIARQQGIYNVLVSAGYINEKPLKQIAPLIDAANIDLKSFSDKTYHSLNGASLSPVLRTLNILHEEGTWLEITNLLIPGYNDDERMIADMCQWLHDNGLSECPLHFSRFFPMYHLSDVNVTPIDTMHRAKDIALNIGIKHVYLGNI